MFKYYRSLITGIQVREVTKKTASENVDGEEEIVIDVDEPESTVEDLPGGRSRNSGEAARSWFRRIARHSGDEPD